MHTYDWSFDDLIAGSLAAHGLTWLPVIDYSAPWSQAVPGNLHSPPSDPAAYAAYAAALAVRYGAGGSFWAAHPELRAKPVQTLEIWNEPDSAQFWPPAPDARRYAALYQQTRDAVAAASPSVRVIVGGLTDEKQFLPALVAAVPSLGAQIDGLAIHPYAATPAGVLARVRNARNALRAVGLGAVPLYVTEFGWRTNPPGAPYYASEPQRRAQIAQTFDALAHGGCGIAVILLYTWMTPEHDPHNGEEWYGINPPNEVSRENTAAFAEALARAHASRPSDMICP
jgi:hypothetical protein